MLYYIIKRVRESFGVVLGVVLGILICGSSFVIHIVRWFAITDGFEYWFSVHWILSGFFGLCVVAIPIVGSFLVFKSIMDVWEWSFISAAVFSLLHIIVPVLFMILGVIIEVIEGWIHNRNKRNNY